MMPNMEVFAINFSKEYYVLGGAKSFSVFSNPLWKRHQSQLTTIFGKALKHQLALSQACFPVLSKPIRTTIFTYKT